MQGTSLLLYYNYTITYVVDAQLSFPALTGVLCLAFFIQNCVLSIVRNQAKPENNVRAQNVIL